jgi:hypothetical protein
MSIEAMKEALEALEEIQLAISTTQWLNGKVNDLKEAIKQAERHEPVAWVYSYNGQKSLSMNYVAGVRACPLYKDPTPCQTCEALARTVMMDQTSHDTAPPQREWQGLTDGEREQIEIKANDKSEMTAWEYAHRVGNFTEAKLKEKNNG